MLQSWICRGDVVVDEDVWEPLLPITALCDSVTVSDCKPGKRGLNSQLRPAWRGGGNKWLPHITYSRNWKWTVNSTLVMGHQSDPAHCKNFLFSLVSLELGTPRSLWTSCDSPLGYSWDILMALVAGSAFKAALVGQLRPKGRGPPTLVGLKS